MIQQSNARPGGPKAFFFQISEAIMYWKDMFRFCCFWNLKSDAVPLKNMLWIYHETLTNKSLTWIFAGDFGGRIPLRFKTTIFTFQVLSRVFPELPKHQGSIVLGQQTQDRWGHTFLGQPGKTHTAQCWKIDRYCWWTKSCTAWYV